MREIGGQGKQGRLRLYITKRLRSPRQTGGHSELVSKPPWVRPPPLRFPTSHFPVLTNLRQVRWPDSPHAKTQTWLAAYSFCSIFGEHSICRISEPRDFVLMWIRLVYTAYIFPHSFWGTLNRYASTLYQQHVTQGANSFPGTCSSLLSHRPDNFASVTQQKEDVISHPVNDYDSSTLALQCSCNFPKNFCSESECLHVTW